MAVKREKVHFASVDELLGAPVAEDATTEIRIDQIYPFENHPFKVLDDDNMNDLVESIRNNGVIVPVLVRPDDAGSYEMISGHRRMHAASLAGLTTIPAIIKPMTNDEATIAMVDANMQREEILPSERAYSLKMKMEAMSRQGARLDITCGTECHKSDAADAAGKKTREEIGESIGLKGRQVQNYLRLTELQSEVLNLVDQKKIAITLSVEISYLDIQIQKWISEYVKENGFLKKEQIEAIRSAGDTTEMTQLRMIELMNDALPKPKDNGKVMLPGKKLNQYFPVHYSAVQREEIILRLLSEWSKENKPEEV